MTEQTHWRSYSRATVAKSLDDPDHVAGGVRWNVKGTRALMRFRGAKVSPRHLTPDEARSLTRKGEQWRRGSQE